MYWQPINTGSLCTGSVSTGSVLYRQCMYKYVYVQEFEAALRLFSPLEFEGY